MRIRLAFLLPVTLGLAVAAGLLLSARLVGDAVAGALVTVPGITREQAVAAAVRAVTLSGLLSVVLAVAVGVVLARLIRAPLHRLHQAAAVGGGGWGGAGVVAEVQDARHAVGRTLGELEQRYRTEQRERSALSALVESVSEGIMQLDGNARIVRVNEAGRHLLGLPEDAVGRSVAAAVRTPELRALLVHGAAGGGTGASEVVVDERRLLVSVAPQDAGAVATFVDLTALRRMEEIRRDFVANASHELKTPLTSIRGYTETLLAGDLPPEEQKHFLGTVSRNADRLQRIVDDLLDLSRLESGRWQPQLEPVDVLQLARRAWAGFADRAEERGVAFESASDGDATALADPGAVEQVFTNLFDNALRYTAQGDTIRVMIRSEGDTDDGTTGRPGPHISVEVEDTGAGIPRDALPRIFERFYRVDPARSRAEGGTGLGLSIIKHIVEGMGGSVSARSALGKGTTVRVALPRA